MAQDCYSASVPGSLMLMGEHAVLHDKQAIVCAINKRLTVSLIPNKSSKLRIADTKLGSLEQDLAAISMQTPFKFVLAAVLQFKNALPSGFDLQINSEFDSTVGMGSSAAVTAATVAVLGKFTQNSTLSAAQVFKIARTAILAVQGLGSGADLAASVYGGVLAYRVEPNQVQALAAIPDLTAVYCGYKTPTVEVVKIVADARAKEPQKYAAIFNAMQVCVDAAITAIQANDWVCLGQLFKQHQELQAALGVSDEVLDSIISKLNAAEEILGAKISGSGLGDCVIGLGVLKNPEFAWQSIISVDQQGLVYADH